jgi:hypothetical protein
MRRALPLLAALVLLFGVTDANAGIIAGQSTASGYSGQDPSFDFSYSDGSGNVAHGSLTGIDLGNGRFLITSGTLVVTGGADFGTYSLFPGGPGETSSPTGAFLFNDVLYPSNNPSLDSDGLLFTGNGLEINIWGNSPGNYSFWSWNGSSYNVQSTGPATFQVSAAPEPTTFALFGLMAVGGVGYCGWRRRKPAA